MSDSLGAPPLAPIRSCVAHSSPTEDRRWHGNGDDDGAQGERDKKKTGDGGETPRRNRPARRTVAPWAASEGCGREIPCWWYAPGACRISGLALPACRQHSLHGWPLVCAFRRGREERHFCLLCVFFLLSWREEAVRRHAAIAMILKSRAHTATRKFRCRGCYGSTSFTKLHDAQMTVHT